ncbi:Aft1 HRA domain-containing protein [Phaeosphaeriaceae sp. PMI808]|nr:Aft1 HRA domain-containing protein [Phaeosphaeriaceae sp. PMI808]
MLIHTPAAAAETDAAKPTNTNAQPLAPPPKPSTTGDTPDYFNTVHNPFSLEPNVFEQSFVGGNGTAETPGGRPILPPVANITSPSPLPGITPGWQSLRAGPLSPAMLSGPTGQTDYFSESFRGFPTPNESSLRTGLTPGGGGSMFPAPSPNTQAIFNLQGTGITPGTGDFQAAALRAATQANLKVPTTGAPTSQPEGAAAGMDRQNNFQQPQSQQQRSQNDPYANHDVSSAANDLLSFASQNGSARNNQPQFSMPPQQQNVHAGHMPVQPVVQHNHVRRDTKGSINSMQSVGTGDFSDSGSDQGKTTTRSRAKKGAANGKQAAGSKRKNDEPAKGSRKKSAAASMDDEMMMEPDSDDDMNIKDEDTHKDGRKMTDEEKRKNFLERNRVAALKCRQRKKQWLANLQSKVELFSTENDALSGTVTQLREEIVNLKTLLLAHKDCPVSQAQGLHGAAMNSFLGGDLNHQNPYGIAQLPPNGVHMMPMQPGQMMNRFVYPPPRMPSAGEQENAQYPPKY